MHFLKTGLMVLYVLAASMGSHVIMAQTELETRSVALAKNIKIGDRVDHIRFLGMLQLPNPKVDGTRFSQLSG